MKTGATKDQTPAMTTQPQSTSADNAVRPRRRWRRWGMACFWLLFVAAALGLLTDEERADRLSSMPIVVQLLVSPLMLMVLWFALRRFREPIHRALRRLPLPGWAIFFLTGALVGIGLAANWSISFNLNGTDLHPDLWINTLLYLGIYGGVMLGWYLLKHVYAFDARHVFWIGGSVFALFEQNYVFPLMLISGNVLFAALLYPYLVVSYGVPFAVPFLMTPAEQLPRGQRRLRWGGALLGALLSLLLFNLCGAIWFFVVDLLLGIGQPNI